MIPSTHPSLLERLREPADAAAWDRFVHLYMPLIYNWLRGKGVQEADAQDLAQDVFNQLFEALPKYQHDPNRGKFRSWLKTVVLNKRREWLRKQAARPDAAAGPLIDVAEPQDDADLFGEQEFRQYLYDRAVELMQRDFEPATWEAVLEVIVHGRSAKEVARKRGMRPGAVRAAKLRVLTRLGLELAGMLD